MSPAVSGARRISSELPEKCVEKLQLLNTPEEQMRKLNEVPEIHSDSNMDPDYESAEDDGDSDGKRLDNYSRSTEYSFKGREIISPGTGGSVSSNNWSATPGESKITWESNRSVSRGGQDVESSTTVAVSVSELSHNQGKGVYQTSSHESKTDVNVTDLGAGVQSAGGPTKTTPESLLVNAAAPSSTSETEKIWRYQDPSGKIQGPFSMTQLRKWNTTGYFPANLRIWRVSEKQEDSILLTDALAGKFHKELQQEPQYSNTLQPIKGGTVVGNNGDGGRRGSNSNSNPAGTDGQQSGENWKAGRIDSRLGSFITPQSSSLSGNQIGMAYPAEGIPAASLRGYQSSNDLNASSGQLQGYNNQRPTPFSGNTYQPPSYQSWEGPGVNNGGWNQSQVCQNTWNSDQPTGLQPGGQGIERQHQDWSSSRQQFPGQHWQGQLASGFSNQSGSDSFHTSNPTPQTRSRNETSYHSMLNSVSPSAQPMHSGWGTTPSGTQAQQSLTATKVDNQQNSLSVGGAPVILANQQIANELHHKDGPLNGAAVLGSSSAIGFTSGSDNNQSLGSDLAPKHELAPTADSNSESSQPVHSHSNERGGDPGLHDGSASQTKIIGIDGGRSDPAAFSTVPSGISDLPVSAFTEGDCLKLRCSASDEAAVDTKLMVQSDASESVSAQNQDPNGSNVNSGAAEKICEQTRSEETQPSSTSLAPSTSGDCKLPSGMNTVQLSKASLSSNARVSGGEPAVSFTSTNSQMDQSVTCEPSPSNALNASASTEAVQSSNIGCGTVANDVQNPGLAVAPQNSNPGPGGVQQGFGNMPYGTAMQGSPNMGWGMVGQGNTNMAWGTPANLNMGWGPLAQPNTNANTGFGLLPQGNPNMNMAWGPAAQGNINPNAGWGAAVMQGNATLNPGWVAPAQGNVNTTAGWMVPTPGNADQTASWGAPVQGNATPTPGWVIPAQTTANPNPGWVAPTTGNTNQNASWGSPMQGTGQGMAWDQSSGNCNGWNAQQQQSGSGHFSPGHGSGRKTGNRMQRSGGGGGPSRPPSRGQRGVCRWFQENGYCKKGANCEYIHPEPTER